MADGPKTRYGIPVGPDGYVPEAELIKHFEAVMRRKQILYDMERIKAAESGKHMPNINLAKRDYDSTSDTVIPLRCTPEQVAAYEESITGRYIAEELNVKNVEFSDDEEALVHRSCKANFKALGSRLGKNMKAAAAETNNLFIYPPQG